MHVVPKKGGMTVILNDKNELIPIRTAPGWRMYIDYRRLNKLQENITSLYLLWIKCLKDYSVNNFIAS